MKNWAEEYENIGHSHEIFTQNLDRTVTNVVQLLMLKAMTISTAESCTGGLLSELITSVPGASQVFELGVCTYSNRIKQALLNVPEGMLAQYGPVSRQVALAMVRGLKEKSDADLCISVTGLAGPGAARRNRLCRLRVWKHGVGVRLAAVGIGRNQQEQHTAAHSPMRIRNRRAHIGGGW